MLVRNLLGSLEKGPALEKLVPGLLSVCGWPGPHLRATPDHKTTGGREEMKSLTWENVGKKHSSTLLEGGSRVTGPDA